MSWEGRDPWRDEDYWVSHCQHVYPKTIEEALPPPPKIELIVTPFGSQVVGK